MNNKSPFLIVILLIIIGIIGMFIFSKSKKDTNTAALTGNVSYRERIALPAGSKVEVEIRDVSQADTIAKTFATSSITTKGENVPIPFTVKYDPKKLDTSRTYTVFGRIVYPDGSLGFITDTAIPFLEGGEPKKSVDLVLIGVNEEASVETKALLEGAVFRLEALNDTAMPDESAYVISFSEGGISATICNTMSGTYELTDTTLKALMTSTLKACNEPEGIMDVESAFGALLGEGAKYTVTENSLTLSNDSTTLMFKRVEGDK